MLTHLQPTVEDLPSPHPALVVLEWAAITLMLPLLGLWYHRADPFFLHASFPWLMLAPLLLGLRYGFASGLGSAAALSVLIYVAFRLGRPEVPHFPGSLALGLLLTGMLAGEFCDMWHRRLHRLSELNFHHHLRVQKFTRSYQLLALSHERLERAVLANTRSLRETITYLRERVLTVDPDSPDKSELHHLLMEVLGSFGWLQVAALYRVDDYNILIPQVVAKLGNPKPVPIDAPLLVEALKTKQLTCIRPDSAAPPRPAAGALMEESGPVRISEALLAVIPLVDVHGKMWGVVTVQALPFVALSRDHLNLLAMLGGHMGDLLALAAGGGAYEFHTCLMRSHKNAREHRLAATLLGLVVDPAAAPPTLWSELLEQHRILDQQWLARSKKDHRVLFLVMPLTDVEGVRGFLQRLEVWANHRFGKPLGELGVRSHYIELGESESAQAQLDALKERCEIHG